MSRQDEINQCKADIAALEKNLKKLQEQEIVPARVIQHYENGGKYLVLSVKNLVNTLTARQNDGDGPARDYVILSFDKNGWHAYCDIIDSNVEKYDEKCHSSERVF